MRCNSEAKDPSQLLLRDIWRSSILSRLDDRDRDAVWECGNKEWRDLIVECLLQQHGKDALKHIMSTPHTPTVYEREPSSPPSVKDPRSTKEAIVHALLELQYTTVGGHSVVDGSDGRSERRYQLLDAKNFSSHQVGMAGVREYYLTLGRLVYQPGVGQVYEFRGQVFPSSVLDNSNQCGKIPMSILGDDRLQRKILKTVGDILLSEALWTPVHSLCEQGYWDVIACLLRDPGCKRALSAETSHGRTPLHLALEHERTPIALEMLRRGCFLNTEDNLGKAVTLCANTGNDEVLKDMGSRGLLCGAVLNYDANNCVDYRTEYDGMAPLSLAAYHGRMSTCRLLLDFGAHPLSKSESGYNYPALKLALHESHGEMCSMLAQRMEEANVPLDFELFDDVLWMIEDYLYSEEDPSLASLICKNMAAVFDVMRDAPFRVAPVSYEKRIMQIAKTMRFEVPALMRAYWRIDDDADIPAEYK